MFFVRLFFLSILLYYTEAGLFNDPFYVDEVVDVHGDETKEVPTPVLLDSDKEKDNLTATYEKSTTTSRPYHSYWGYGFENTNSTSATYVSNDTINNKKPSDLDNESERNEPTTTRRSYHSYWGNGFENKTTDGNEQPASDDDDVGYGYLSLENGNLTRSNWERRLRAYYTTSTTENSNTTTTGRPYIPDWQTWERKHWAYHTTSTTENSDTTTTERPYIPDWQTWERRYGAYYTTSTTTENSDTTTTETPYIPDWQTWERRYGAYYTTSTTTENSDTTTTERPYIPGSHIWERRPGADNTTTTEDSPYWGNRTSYYTTTTEDSPYWGNRSSYFTTSTTEGSDTTTTRRPYVICHRGHNSTVGSRCPTSTDGHVKISINSSANINGAENNVAIADFLRKLTGAMLPSASNIAPNSNITNLAVANGNGNVFFNIYN